MHTYDVIIVGAGIAGSCAAYSIAKNMKKPANVLLIEQFKLLHDRGSSHGNSRIIRKTYTLQIYSDMASKSFELWNLAERASGMKVLHKTGGLDFGPSTDRNLLATIDVCKSRGFEYELLDANGLREKFPQMNFEDNWIGVYQDDAGVLNAIEAVRMFQKLAVQEGCKIQEREKLLSLQRMSKDKILVITNKGGYYAKKVVLCCGAWTQKILSKVGINIPLDVWRCTYSFWHLKKSFRESYKVGKFPIWIHFDESNEFYGFPTFEYPYAIKASLHNSTERNIDPDNRSFEPSGKIIEKTRNFMKKVFKGIVDKPDNELKATTCLYTVSKDENFILDVLPNDKDIVVFGAGSGHAFKFGPLLGELINDLVKEKNPTFDISLFSLMRFIDKKRKLVTVGMLRRVEEVEEENRIRSKM